MCLMFIRLEDRKRMLYVSEFHSFYGLIFHCMHILYIHLSVDGDLGCFYLLAIVNKAEMNLRVHISFQISIFVFFG